MDSAAPGYWPGMVVYYVVGAVVLVATIAMLYLTITECRPEEAAELPLGERPAEQV